MSEKLKPCPFCGRANLARYRACGSRYVKKYRGYIRCDCGSMGPAEPSKTAAIAAWNRRTPATSRGEWVQDETNLAIPDFLRAPNAIVPREIDRKRHSKVLDVWNDCMINAETLETTWPRLVEAMLAVSPTGEDKS